MLISLRAVSNYHFGILLMFLAQRNISLRVMKHLKEENVFFQCAVWVYGKRLHIVATLVASTQKVCVVACENHAITFFLYLKIVLYTWVTVGSGVPHSVKPRSVQ